MLSYAKQYKLRMEVIPSAPLIYSRDNKPVHKFTGIHCLISVSMKTIVCIGQMRCLYSACNSEEQVHGL